MSSQYQSAQKTPKSKVVANYAIFTALMVVLNVISFTVPYPIQYIGFAPVLIFFIGLTLKPMRAFALSSIGSVLGQFIYNIIIGDYITLGVYCLGAFVARGIEALLISTLVWFLVRKREKPKQAVIAIEVVILCIACVWEYLGYAIVGTPYMMAVYGMTALDSFVIYLYVLFDLIFVPVGLLVTIGVRKYFQADYLDRLLYNDAS
jgi:hypothetical protein